MTILNGILFLCCVMLFNLSMISLLLGAFPIFIILAFLFVLCYKAMRYNGPKPKQIHLTYFNGDNIIEHEEIDDYQKPFNRDNFEFN